MTLTILGVEYEVIRRTARVVIVRRLDGDRIPFHGSEKAYPASALGLDENSPEKALPEPPAAPPAPTVERPADPVTVTWEAANDPGEPLRLF